MRRRRRVLGPLVAATVVAGLATVVWAQVGSKGDERVHALLDDRAGYDTAVEAGDTIAKISGLLLADARRCNDKGDDALRCDAVAQAAAFAQALAVRALECTAPGRFEVRRVLREHLRAVEAMAPTDPVPSLPPLPTC